MMRNSLNLDLGKRLILQRLNDISDLIVYESFKASDAAVQIRKSIPVVSATLEVSALLLHAASRTLPRLEGDYLNDLIYSPLVRLCCEGLGNLVEQLQDSGAFDPPIFCGEDIERDAFKIVDTRGKEYSNLAELISTSPNYHYDVFSHAAKGISDLAGAELSIPFVSKVYQLLTEALDAVDLQNGLQQIQKAMTPEMRAYLAIKS